MSWTGAPSISLDVFLGLFTPPPSLTIFQPAPVGGAVSSPPPVFGEEVLRFCRSEAKALLRFRTGDRDVRIRRRGASRQ